MTQRNHTQTTRTILSLLLLGACWLTQPAAAVTQWWDTSSAAGLLTGTGVWSTTENFWATNSNPVAGNGPFAWVNGNDAVFSGIATAVVNGVTANSISVGGTFVRLTPGTGPLTLGAGGVALDYRWLYADCPIVIGTDQMWSINNTAGQIFSGAISGPGHLTVRNGAGSYNGAFTLTNAANAFNSFTTYGVGGSPGTLGGLTIMAGTITNGLTLGAPGGSATNGASLLITNAMGVVTSAVGDVTIASPAVLSLTTATASTNTFAAGNLARLGHATLELFGPNGTTVIATFTNGPSMTNSLVAPWVANPALFNFYTYAPNGTLSNLTPRNITAFDANTYTQAVNPTANITLASGASAQALVNTKTINLSGNTLTLGGGTYAGIILNGGIITNSSTSGTLDFGGAEALISGSGTIASRLSNLTCLTKFGNGTLTLLSDALAYGGPIWLNNGTLTFKPAGDQTLTNAIIGPGYLSKDGPNTLTLSGTNVFSLGTIGGSSTLAFSGGVFTNLVVGGANIFNGNYNTCLVTNGCRFVMPYAAALNGASNSVLVTGSNSVWDSVAGAPQMTFSADERLRATDGGSVTNVGLIQLADRTVLAATNGGQIAATSILLKGVVGSTVWVGGTNAAGIPSRLTLTSGGISHSTYTATSNTVIVADNGILTSAGAVALGYSWSSTGDCNRLIVTNGGRASITAGTSTLGYCPNNAIWVGGTNPAGSASVINWNNNRCEVGFSSWTNNRATVDAGGIMTNAAFSVGDDISGVNVPFNAWLIVTNGGRLYGSVAVGTKSHQNTFVITGSNSLFSAGGTSLSIGAASNNALFVDGGVLTNLNSFSVGYIQQAISYGIGNSATITNGGQLYCTGTVYVGDTESYVSRLAVSNQLLVAGSGSVMSIGGAALNIGTLNFAGDAGVGNCVQITAGGVLTNAGTVTVGGTSASSTNQANRLVISTGGALFASTLNVGSGAGITTGNVVTVADGAMLEANTLACYNTVNTISNSAGIYQFTTATPTITPNTNVIAINSGTLSFRNVTNTSVSANVFGTLLTNLTWSGNNGFRLTAATNGTTTSQTYVFEPGITPTNYARLEMVSGSTCYRGQSTNSLTIGLNPGSGASMLCSNTAAVVTIPFTNNATLRIVNSTLTFTTNAVLNGTVIVDLNRLANTGTVLIAQKDLTLGGSSALQFVGTPTTNLTLMTYTGARNGKFQITGLPYNYSVFYSATQNGVVSLNKTPPGTALFML